MAAGTNLSIMILNQILTIKKNKILDFSQKLSRNASHNVSDKISQNVSDNTSHNVSDKTSQNEFWNTNHSKKNLSDDSIADDNEDALISVLKVKQNIIRWLNILRLYFGDGSSNVHGLRDFFRWFVIFAFASFLTGRAAGNDNYDIFLIPFVIVCSVCVISRVFENKKSLILSLGISWRQHIKNSYITSALMIVFIITAFSFFLVFFSGGKAVSGNSIIYNGIRLNTGGMIYIIIFYIILFFMYFPLAYIAKNKIWWIYSAGVSLILYFIVYIMMTAFKLGSIYAGNGNFISRFESIPYYQWYLFGLLVICAISTRLSVRISKYFYMKI